MNRGLHPEHRGLSDRGLSPGDRVVGIWCFLHSRGQETHSRGQGTHSLGQGTHSGGGTAGNRGTQHHP